MTNYSNTELRHGKRLLKELLPLAKAESRKMQTDNPENFNGLQPTSPLGQTIMQIIREKNLDALVVYERGADRWYADIVLKGLPVGYSNVMGTPIATPEVSEAAAGKSARSLLVSLCSAIRDNEIGNRDKPLEDLRIFALYGRHFQFPGKMVDQINDLKSVMSEYDYGDVALMHVRLSDNLMAIMEGPGFDEEKWLAASNDARQKVAANMITLLTHDEFRFPPRPEAGFTPEP